MDFSVYFFLQEELLQRKRKRTTLYMLPQRSKEIRNKNKSVKGRKKTCLSIVAPLLCIIHCSLHHLCFHFSNLYQQSLLHGFSLSLNVHLL